MKTIALLVFTATSTILAAAPKSYQVTGPVVSVTDNLITVDKTGEKWEVSRDSSTIIKGDLKPGSKVTVKYKMVATDIEVKEEKAKKK